MKVQDLIKRVEGSQDLIEVPPHGFIELADILPSLEQDAPSEPVTTALRAYLDRRYHDVLRTLSQQSDLKACLLKQLALLRLIDSPTISPELRKRVFLQLQDCIKEDKTGKLVQQLGLLGSALGYR
jgi:hypothetical protein